MNLIQKVYLTLVVFTFVRFSLYILAVSIAGIAIKFKRESKAVNLVLKVLIYLAIYPRHKKYFEAGGHD